MKFRTKIDIEPGRLKIGYDTPVMLTGSCFAEEIGRQFSDGKMIVMTNPFGVMYNPLSVLRSLELIMEGRDFTERDLYIYNNRYLSFSHDTSFSSRNSKESLERINASISEARKFLSEASFLFITFGTAWVYRWKEDNGIVANCHKIPASRFTRQLLEKEDIVLPWTGLISELKTFNPDLSIIFTVSPVRHLKDGAHGNQISKATLMLAINDLITKNEELAYFPSYELIMDELRDYRFFKKDMLHPNEIAVEYVWTRLRKSYFSDDTEKLYERLMKITEATRHVITGDDAAERHRFSQSMLERIKNIISDYPGLDLREEEEYFKLLAEK